MKKCAKCKVEKSFGLFSRNIRRHDGHQTYCKSCVKEYEQTARYKASKARYMKTDKGRATIIKYNASNPYKRTAHKLVECAIRRGELKRPHFCAVCWITCNTEAHHDDYNEPLEVRWLCRTCHKSWHKENQAIQYKGE